MRLTGRASFVRIVRREVRADVCDCATSAAGELVTLNDAAPSTDRWNMAAVEVRGDDVATLPAPEATPATARARVPGRTPPLTR
jgi:hypothetical protein